MLTARDFQIIVNDYLRTPEGAADVQAQGGVLPLLYSNDEMLAMANELLSEIKSAFERIQLHGHPFDTSQIKVNAPRDMNTGVWKLTIYFPPISIARTSLVQQNARGIRFTGDKYRESHANMYGSLPDYYSVYDVIGLFTKGYRTEKRVFGAWSHAEPFVKNPKTRDDADFSEDSFIQNMKYLPPSDFVTQAVDAFMARHPGVKVQYPVAWGGTK